jgi:hypothetical protein
MANVLVYLAGGVLPTLYGAILQGSVPALA